MATTVCTTNDFDTDPATGRLRVNICGDPASADFCEGGTNAIKRDAECGLYVHAAFSVENRIPAAAPGRYQQPNLVIRPGQTSPAELASTNATDWVFTNPSACCPATAVVYVAHYVTLNMTPGSVADVLSVTSRASGQQTVAAYTVTHPDEDGTGLNLQLECKVVDAVTFTMAAGAPAAPVFTEVRVRNRSATTATPRRDVRFVDVLHDGFATINSGNC